MKKLLGMTTNYHAKNFLTENVLAIDMRKTQMPINKPVHLALPVLELSKTVMYEFWYDYVKPKYGEKTKYVIWIQTKQ